MGRLLLGMLIGLCILPLILLASILLGVAPVATSSGALPLEQPLASIALHAREAKEAPKGVPIPADETNLVSGARIYRDYCLLCHGAMTGIKTVFQRGMYPPPPLLLQGKGVTDDPPEQTYWVVRNGIRTTGMPAFSSVLTDTQLWQVSLMVANAHNLPPGVGQYIARLPNEWQ
jgi:thiosulfate dehydrogenase